MIILRHTERYGRIVQHGLPKTRHAHLSVCCDDSLVKSHMHVDKSEKEHVVWGFLHITVCGLYIVPQVYCPPQGRASPAFTSSTGVTSRWCWVNTYETTRSGGDSCLEPRPGVLRIEFLLAALFPHPPLSVFFPFPSLSPFFFCFLWLVERHLGDLRGRV